MESLQLGFLVISRVMENDKLIGFLLVDSTGRLKMVSIDQVNKAGFNANYFNAEYSPNYKTLNGIDGVSLTRCPSITKDYVLQSKDGISVLCTILDSKTGNPIGVVAYNGIGTKFNLTYKRLNELSSKFNCCNFDMVNDKQYGLIAIKKNGQYFGTITMEVPNQQPQKGNSCVSSCAKNELPVIKAYSMDYIKDSEFNQPCQDKLVKTMLNMQKLTPYYYTIFTALKRLPAPIGMMGVTEDTLLYDIEFVANLQVPELTFVLIHEVLHIAMQHSVRFGSRKDRDLWNIATDLYINSIICNDFNCSFGGGAINIGDKLNPISIKTPDFGVYMETVGKKIDLAIDTPESIYDELLKENKNRHQQSGQGQQSNNQNGQGQSSQQGAQQGAQQVMQGAHQAQQNCGNSSQSQQAMQQIQQGAQQLQQGMQNGNQQQAQQGAQQMQNGVNQMNQAQNQSGQGGTSQGNNASQQMQNGMNQINDALNQSSGQGQGQNGDAFGDDGLSQKQNSDVVDNINQGNEQHNPMQEVNVVYNGKVLKGSIMKDIMSNTKRDSKEAIDAAIEKGKQALQNIKTKLKIEEEKTGEPLVKNAGHGGALTQRYIEFGLSNGVDWRILFRNICKDKPKKTFTLAQPNQDYMNSGMTIADRRAIGKPTHISHVKFAVDISGSVTKKELQKMLSEINNIYTHFKMDGELIYWSTMIGDAGMFSNLKDMLKVQPNSDGGTDVKCVFEYLAGETKVHGKFEQDKVKDIKAIFILTDGCFGNNYAKYERAFGKRVVWLITGKRGNPITFNPPFGRVIGIDLD